MDNKKYIDILIVSGKIDRDVINSEKEIIDSIISRKTCIKEYMDVLFKHKLGDVSSFIACGDAILKLLDKDNNEQRRNEFMHELCVMINEFIEILPYVKLMRVFANFREVIDSYEDKDVDYESIQNSLKVLKIQRYSRNQKFKINGQLLYLNKDNYNESDDTFDLIDVNCKEVCKGIKVVVIKEKSIECITSKSIQNKAETLIKYIEDPDTIMVIYYEDNNETLTNKLLSRYSIEEDISDK